MNQDPVIHIILPLSQVNVLGQGIGELPLKIAGQVTAELNKQVGGS